MDSTENPRRHLVALINTLPATREALEACYGQGNVFDTSALSRRFEPIGFAAPFVVVRERATGRRGSLMFQHMPRVYFGWQPDE